jgi:DNA topoisomerase-1
MTRHLLIVESPSKAKTLKKYLGRNFEVLASYGHVRDLEAKEGAVDPQDGFRMRYALVEKNKKHVDAIARAAADADQVLLATDPDREGEAIAWHLSEILKSKKALKSRPVSRVVFYEITESAIKDGRQPPACDLDAAGERTAGAPCARSSRWFQLISAALEENRAESIRGARAKPGPAIDRRART